MRLAIWPLLLFAALCLVGIARVVGDSTPPIQPPPPATPAPPNRDVKTCAATSPPSTGTYPAARFPRWLGLVAASAIMAGGALLAGLGNAESELRRRSRAALNEQRGLSSYWARGKASEPLSTEVVEGVAKLLPAPNTMLQREELDVERTLARTLANGLLTCFVFAERRRPVRTLILDDRARSMQPWFGAAEELARGLELRGFDVKLVPFGAGYAPAGGLRALAAQLAMQAAEYDASAIILVSDGGSLLGRPIAGPFDACCLDQLAKRWPLTLVLNPVDSVEWWHPGLRDYAGPVRLGILDADGVVELRRTRAAKPAPRPVRINSGQVEAFELLLALQPGMPIRLAFEAFRRVFPQTPSSLLLAHGAKHGRSEALGEAGQAGSVQRSKERLERDSLPADELETTFRRILLETVENNEPAKGSLAYLRWRRDVATHRVHLARASEQRAAALAELQGLLETPLAAELLSSKHQVGNRTANDKLVDDALKLPLRTNLRFGDQIIKRSWLGRPGWGVVACALLVGVPLLSGTALGLTVQRARAVNTSTGYAFEVVGNELHVTRNQDGTLPAWQIFRDGKRWNREGKNGVYPLEPEDMGGCFVAQAEVPPDSLIRSPERLISAATAAGAEELAAAAEKKKAAAAERKAEDERRKAEDDLAAARAKDPASQAACKACLAMATRGNIQGAASKYKSCADQDSQEACRNTARSGAAALLRTVSPKGPSPGDCANLRLLAVANTNMLLGLPNDLMRRAVECFTRYPSFCR